MDWPPEQPAEKPPPSPGGRRENQLQGPRPARLRVCKESQKIRKPPVAPRARGHHVPSEKSPADTQPMIIYSVSPKPYHVGPTNFMSLVQKLTEWDLHPSTAGELLVSPAVRLASFERSSPKEWRRGGGDGGEESGGADDVGSWRPGILSPAPANLIPAISPGMFSPPAVEGHLGYSDLLMSPFMGISGNLSFPSPSGALFPTGVSPLPSPDQSDRLSQEGVQKTELLSHKTKPSSSAAAVVDKTARTKLKLRALQEMLQTIWCLQHNYHLSVPRQESGSRSDSNSSFSFPDDPRVSLLDLIWQSESAGVNSGGTWASAVCIDCLLCLSILPKDCEVDGDTLVQLWVATGLAEEVSAEDIAVNYLEALQSEGCLAFVREDQRTGKLWYKVADFFMSKDMSSRINHVRAPDSDDPTMIARSPQHLTIRGRLADLKVFKWCGSTSTLWFLHDNKCSIKRVPYDLFMSLRSLKVLHLSHTKISELPSSVGNLEHLRYLDLSETLIKQLPGTICLLQKLQTLKLQNCTNLTALPKHTTKLTSLRHLDLGTRCHLRVMPAGMGALTGLRTLSEFVVGLERGSGIAELRELDNLKGRISLSRLQNATLRDAEEAYLCRKQSLRILELHWGPRKPGNLSILDDQVLLECLKPHRNLKDLRVFHYGGSRLPSWIGDPSFVNLGSVSLFNCENCSFLTSLMQLPALKTVSLHGLPKVRSIGSSICRASAPPDANFAYPTLQNLVIKSMHNLEECRGLGDYHFPSLLKLIIRDCPKLLALCCLTSMSCLRHLELSDCPLVPSLPEGRLPASVEKLVIEDCPLLKSSCSKPDGQDWHKIQHISSLWIDYEEMS